MSLATERGVPGSSGIEVSISLGLCIGRSSLTLGTEIVVQNGLSVFQSSGTAKESDGTSGRQWEKRDKGTTFDPCVTCLVVGVSYLTRGAAPHGPVLSSTFRPQESREVADGLLN